MNKIILLDSIRSMQNIWVIFRNCDWAWFEKVILTWHSPTPPRSDISKTALGAQNWIDWEYCYDPLVVVKDLKNLWYKIYCVEFDKDAIEYTELFKRNDKKVCLIMWNEIFWVNQRLLDVSDDIISIPMRWQKESLNVSVAAGVVMYAV